jgi:hypothetical protein
VVPPPRWERPRRTASAKDGKGEDKESQETGTVKGARHQVRVVLEDAGAVVSEVELREETGNELAEDDTSLACVVGDVTSKLEKLWQIELIKTNASDLGDELLTDKRLA